MAKREMAAPPIAPSNQSAPAGVGRGGASWREDLAAYDALPPELRLAVQEAPFEMDAVGVSRALTLHAYRFGSQAMAIAMVGAEIGRFTARALEAAEREREGAR